jgi:hypothetical protein
MRVGRRTAARRDVFRGHITLFVIYISSFPRRRVRELQADRVGKSCLHAHQPTAAPGIDGRVQRAEVVGQACWPAKVVAEGIVIVEFHIPSDRPPWSARMSSGRLFSRRELLFHARSIILMQSTQPVIVADL